MAGNDMSIQWITKPFTDVMVDLNRVTDRATMYALRETGRKAIVPPAKARAPVYKDRLDPRALAEKGQLRRSIKNARQLNHMGTGDYSLKVGPWGSKKKGTAVSRYGAGEGSTMHRIAQGKLYMQSGGKAGTQYSRSSKKNPGGTSSEGQVRGVPLYRGQMEDEYGYMANGTAAAGASIRAIYEAAMAKALAKYR